MLQKSTKVPNAYIVMGVFPGLSDEQLKEAYLELAKKNHPDVGGSHERFSAITEAYGWVRTPELRRKHDQRLAILGLNCPTCLGKGYVSRSKGFTYKVDVICSACKGTGAKS